MKVSPRELHLAFFTLLIVVLGLSYWWAEPRLTALNEREAALAQLERERRLAIYEMSRQDEWEAQLTSFSDQLPRHTREARVTADLLRMIERTATESRLDLLARVPEDERSLVDLYEVSINCTWEGSLEALVRFLYAIQAQGAVLDIRTLTVSPKREDSERLTGRFTIDCAYSRAAQPDQPDVKPETS